jgi:hypothetical protein
MAMRPHPGPGPLALETHDVDDTPRPPEAARPTRLWSHPIRYGELVAHLSDYLCVLVTTRCGPKHGKAKKDIFEQPNVVMLIIGPHHLQAGATIGALALISVRDCVEPTSDRAALSSEQASEWQTTMQQE